jgi:hypothetical protein
MGDEKEKICITGFGRYKEVRQDYDAGTRGE